MRKLDVPKPVTGITSSSQNALIVFQYVNGIFIEDYDTVIIAQLPDGYER